VTIFLFYFIDVDMSSVPFIYTIYLSFFANLPGETFTVLPTPGETFRSDQQKNSAAGEKVRPLIKYTHKG
jgi:hypothetical protein